MDLRHLDERERIARTAAFAARGTLANIVRLIVEGRLADVGLPMILRVKNHLDQIQKLADDALADIFDAEEVEA